MTKYQQKIIDKISAYLNGGGATMQEIDGKHVYGDGLPSASEILRIFSFGDFANVNQEKLDEAAHIGKNVHFTIAMIFLSKHGLAFVDDMVMDDIRYQNCMKAFTDWRKDKEIIPVGVELKLLSEKHGFGGTIDLVAFVGETLTLLDWKSGPIKFRDFIQLELYALLLRHCTGIIARDCVLVQLKKETGEAKERRCPDRKKSKAFALKVLRFWKQTEDFKKLVDGRRHINL